MTRIYAIIPAAGVGSRMQAACPKQYLPVHGRPLIWYAIRPLYEQREITQVQVVLSADDGYWPQYDWSDYPHLSVARCGGNTRAETVHNALQVLIEQHALTNDDWVLVHDAARPGLSSALLSDLLNAVTNEPDEHDESNESNEPKKSCGGLLAIPVADTLKRAGHDHGPYVAQTVSRESLWQAQTPQIFRAQLLYNALSQAKNVTDESSAIEQAGGRPKLVMGSLSNLKITYPEDLALIQAWLSS